jgi:hypothetical protein
MLLAERVVAGAGCLTGLMTNPIVPAGGRQPD